MTPKEIESILRELAESELEAPASQLEARIENLDSLERMQLAMVVEDRFHILVEASDEAELATLADLVALVGRKLEGAQP
jgi:acyl carrier protein